MRTCTRTRKHTPRSHANAHAQAHSQANSHAHSPTHTHTHTHTHTLTHKHTNTHTLAHIHTHSHTYTHSNTQTHTHTHAHAHTRTRTHTHTHAYVWLDVCKPGLIRCHACSSRHLCAALFLHTYILQREWQPGCAQTPFAWILRKASLRCDTGGACTTVCWGGVLSSHEHLKRRSRSNWQVRWRFFVCCEGTRFLFFRCVEREATATKQATLQYYAGPSQLLQAKNQVVPRRLEGCWTTQKIELFLGANSKWTLTVGWPPSLPPVSSTPPVSSLPPPVLSPLLHHPIEVTQGNVCQLFACRANRWPTLPWWCRCGSVQRYSDEPEKLIMRPQGP